MTGMTRFRYGWSPHKPLKSSGNDRVDADDAVFPTPFLTTPISGTRPHPNPPF